VGLCVWWRIQKGGGGEKTVPPMEKTPNPPSLCELRGDKAFQTIHIQDEKEQKTIKFFALINQKNTPVFKIVPDNTSTKNRKK